MSRCPSERALARLFAGAGRAADEAHLARCPACDQRYRRLADDVARIGVVLEQTAAVRTTLVPREQGPQSTAPRHERAPRSRTTRWAWGAGAISAAAAVLVVLTIAAGNRPVDRHVARVAASSVPAPDAMHAAVRDVSTALFQLGAAEPAYQVPRPRSPSSYVQAALEGGGPCRRVGPAVACE